MRLHLYRRQFLPTCSKGILYVNGSFECFTLEPPRTFDSKINLSVVTCIPEGTYQLVKNASAHMHCDVPLLLHVPDREEIEMHVLNVPCQTHGCIGVGDTWTAKPEIDNSQAAFDRLMGYLNNAWARGELANITITDLEGSAYA